MNVCLCTVHSACVHLLLTLLEVSLHFLRPWSVGWWRLEQWTDRETHPRQWHLAEVEEGALYRLILGLCLQDKAVAQESRQKRLFHHCKQAIKFPQYTVKSTLCVCVSLCVCVYVCKFYHCVEQCPPPRLWSIRPAHSCSSVVTSSPPAPSSHWPALLHLHRRSHTWGHAVCHLWGWHPLSRACVAARWLVTSDVNLHCSGKIEFARFPHCKVTLTPFP